LGIFIDQHINWSVHINHISAKIAKSIGIITRISALIPKEVLLNLYYSLVYPYLSYGNLVWASNYKTNLLRLHLLQKRIIRVLARSAPYSHTHHLFLQLRLLNIFQITDYQIAEFMYRYTFNMLPIAFSKYFKRISDVHSYHTRYKSGRYRVDYSRTNIRKFSIVLMGPRCWNDLPQDLRLTPSLGVFKRLLRAYLLESVKSCHLP
jgi:hypothetical protein